MEKSLVTVLGSWSAEDTNAGAVETALTELRRHEVRAAVRTAVLTLVVPVREDEAAEALDVVRQLGGRHPSRTIVLIVEDGNAAGLDAEVTVQAVEREGRAVCFEDLVLRVRGSTVSHLDSLVEPFTLPDVPVACWLPNRLPTLADPLLGAADRVVVDGREAITGDALTDLTALVRRLPVVDLSWVRLSPWRELMAGLFEGEAFRPFVSGVRAVRVSGKPGPRVLLAGWLLSRLGLSRAKVHLEDARHATMEVMATHDGRTGHFRVERPSEDRTVHANAEIEGGPSHSRLLRLRDRSAARVLGEALTRMGHDQVYEQALAAAVDLV